MKRRRFIEGSAIIGASLITPSMMGCQSGMYSMLGTRKVHKVLSASKTKVGTLPILRAFAGNHLDYVSPFVLFDEFGPVSITPGTDALRVGAHPHAGVIPTTFFLSGSGHHKDSLNYDFQVEQGEFMMFNSGKGAIHMEESGDRLKQNGGSLHGFQIWLNMPAKNKFDDPTTAVFQDQQMPTIVKKGYTAKVILGNLFGAKSTVPLLTPTFYYHIKLKKDQRLDLPTDPTHNAFVYCVKGNLEIESQKKLQQNQIALYDRGESLINLYAPEEAEFFVLGGQPLNEPVYSYGPFVMNNKEEIELCYKNYQSGKMGDPNQVNR